MNLRSVYHILIIALLGTPLVQAQRSDLAMIHHGPDGISAFYLFNTEDPVFERNTAFRAKNSDLNASYPQLTLSGDFTGDLLLL